MVNDGLLAFEGVITYGAKDGAEAERFFERTLGLEPLESGEGDVRFYPLSPDIALAVDTSGSYEGAPPYLLFSSPDLDAARQHFLGNGCTVIEMGPDPAPNVGFFAHAPEGHMVCVVAQGTLEDGE
ncbi:MAG: hypothetical protein IVW36_03660 [Dehalococcoidia bacterium]|nr:hypothetical protein [Dehalococcoidia bacterium]